MYIYKVEKKKKKRKRGEEENNYTILCISSKHQIDMVLNLGFSSIPVL